MPEELDDNSQSTTPEEPGDDATSNEEHAPEPLGDDTGTGKPPTDGQMEEPAPAAGSTTPSDTAGAPEIADDAKVEPAAVADTGEAAPADVESPDMVEEQPVTGPANEVEAAMQEMLNAAERSSGEEASDGAAESGPNNVSADEIESAMQEMLAAASSDAGEGHAAQTASNGNAISAEEIEAALQAAGNLVEEAGVAAESSPEPPPNTAVFEAPDFTAESGGLDASQIDLLDDVELDVKIELGRAEMFIENVLGLGAGSVVELDKAAGDPVDIFVNDRLVARGEVLVLNDNFCVRINDIISPIPELDKEG